MVLIANDVSSRANAIRRFDALHLLEYAASSLLVASFWSVLLMGVSRHPQRRVRALSGGVFVLMFGFAAGVQRAFFERYRLYCGQDALVEHRGGASTLICVLPGTSSLVVYLALGFSVAGMFTWLASRSHLPFPMRSWRYLVGALVVLVFVLPNSQQTWQSASPEQMYFGALAGTLQERIPPLRTLRVTRMQRRHPTPVPTLQSQRREPPSILLILDESVGYSAHRQAAPQARAALDGALQFEELRAVDSSTVISMSVLLTGRPPTDSQSELLAAPTLWGYADAAGYFTAYWTSQNVIPLGVRFMSQDEPIDAFAMANHLEPLPDPDAGASDRALCDFVAGRIASLPRPFFAMVQLSNAHYPYRIDEADAPFTPETDSLHDMLDMVMATRRARYLNAVHQSDAALAAFLTRLREMPAASNMVVIYTSDHGEAFGENGNIGHMVGVFDSEIHVPGWIWASPGSLTPTEVAQLGSLQKTAIYHVDIAPTILDLMGLWDVDGLQSFKEAMPGRPLTRPVVREAPVALTNCSWVWQCRDANYGVMRFPFKLHARRVDDSSEYRCYDVRSDPGEQTDLGESACEDLGSHARRLYGVMPNAIPSNHDPPR